MYVESQKERSAERVPDKRKKRNMVRTARVLGDNGAGKAQDIGAFVFIRRPVTTARTTTTATGTAWNLVHRAG